MIAGQDGNLDDRLSRGEAVPGGPGACDRDGCAHLTLWHGERGRYRGRPCRQCGCPAYVPQPEGAGILGQLHAVLTRYVILPSAEAAVAVVLWIAATHAQPAWAHAPRLVIRGPVKRCGKSRLLDIVEGTCHAPLITVNASPAARVPVGQAKGYHRPDFADAWARYCPPGAGVPVPSVPSSFSQVTPGTDSGLVRIDPYQQPAPWYGSIRTTDQSVPHLSSQNELGTDGTGTPPGDVTDGGAA